MHRTDRCPKLVALALIFVALNAQPLRAAGDVVRAVLFYSPSCGHCHYVITEVLPPLMEQYGQQFEIVGVNTADPQGQQMYRATITSFHVAEERRGVPLLIVGDHVLVGSLEIPEQLPGLIEAYLEQGGVDWPAIPGLAEAMAAAAITPTPAATTEIAAPSPTPVSVSPAPATSAALTPSSTPAPPPASPTPAAPVILGVDSASSSGNDWRANFQSDPVGNTLSIVVLLGMVFSLVYRVVTIRRPAGPAAVNYWRWAIPPLVAPGLIVAGYLAYVETQKVSAVCGPVGDCNTVQQSEFALLFGFVPVAVLGLLGYVGIGLAWFVARCRSGLWADLALLSLQAMTWLGLLFSIYLTFLEPFVIGATCAWCLASALTMMMLFWTVTPAALPVLASLRTRFGDPVSV
jgi:uncharacterized membrane protein/thiol-disulfide isomerase/thioredoxin